MKKIAWYCLLIGTIFLLTLSLCLACFAQDVIGKASEVSIEFEKSKCTVYLDLKVALWIVSSLEEDRDKPKDNLRFSFKLYPVTENGRDKIILADDKNQVIWRMDKDIGKQQITAKADEIFLAIRAYVRGFKAGLKTKNS